MNKKQDESKLKRGAIMLEQTSAAMTHKISTKALIANTMKKYQGEAFIVKSDFRRLRQIEKALDRSLSILDKLRCKTENEEKNVLGSYKRAAVIARKIE